jgi:hypothetical protein
MPLKDIYPDYEKSVARLLKIITKHGENFEISNRLGNGRFGVKQRKKSRRERERFC